MVEFEEQTTWIVMLTPILEGFSSHEGVQTAYVKLNYHSTSFPVPLPTPTGWLKSGAHVELGLADSILLANYLKVNVVHCTLMI